MVSLMMETMVMLLRLPLRLLLMLMLFLPRLRLLLLLLLLGAFEIVLLFLLLLMLLLLFLPFEIHRKSKVQGNTGFTRGEPLVAEKPHPVPQLRCTLINEPTN